jgi:NAD(P)-dependent dehydrogenase (short-subunit alcohol dehydrogenase family)
MYYHPKFKKMESNLFSIVNKVIVVTGGTGILGTAFCNAISKAGGIVVIIGRTQSKCDAAADIVIKNGGKALGVAANVLQEKELQKAKEIIIEKFGKIDGLVNAAGGNVPDAVVQPQQDIFELNMDALKTAMELNLWGTILPTQIFGKQMALQGAGSIVNISSVSAKNALTRVLGYSLGKSAIDAYTKWFSVELANRYADTIRMNSITPGFFLTEQNKTLLTNEDGSLTDRGNKINAQTPFKRFGNPDELCGALIYLLSDASKFVTGADIVIDGGFTKFSGV